MADSGNVLIHIYDHLQKVEDEVIQAKGAINDEFDKLEEEANREAAKEKAKLEYSLSKQDHSLKLVNAVNSGAMAIIKAWIFILLLKATKEELLMAAYNKAILYNSRI